MPHDNVERLCRRRHNRAPSMSGAGRVAKYRELSKVITAQEITAQAAVETAIATLLSTWSSTKTSDLGAVLDRMKALRLLTQATVRMGRRGFQRTL